MPITALLVTSRSRGLRKRSPFQGPYGWDSCCWYKGATGDCKVVQVRMMFVLASFKFYIQVIRIKRGTCISVSALVQVLCGAVVLSLSRILDVLTCLRHCDDLGQQALWRYCLLRRLPHTAKQQTPPWSRRPWPDAFTEKSSSSIHMPSINGMQPWTRG